MVISLDSQIRNTHAYYTKPDSSFSITLKLYFAIIATQCCETGNTITAHTNLLCVVLSCFLGFFVYFKSFFMQYDVFKSVRTTKFMTIVLVNLPSFIPEYPHTKIPLFLFNFSSVNFEYFSTHKMLSNVYVGVYFTCADDGIGRVDRSTLGQQSLMELFIFGLNEPEKICGNRDDPDDVCEWKGVKCNVHGEVEEFHWNFKQDNGIGTVGLEFLPCSMKYVQMFRNALSGTIQLADLPGKMEVVDISFNNLIGCLDLDRLPAAVRSVDLSGNKFTGDISLENLPKGLEILSLLDNQLSGGADGAVASAGLRAQRRSIAPRSRRLAGHRPDGWPSLDGGSV